MPNNTIYGGLGVYPSTPFLIDKVYKNRKEMDDNCADDGIFVGRYVMIRYCNDNFDQETRKEIHIHATPNTLVGHMKEYYDQYIIDKTAYSQLFIQNNKYFSYDHTIWRKELDENKQPYYAPIGRTDISYAPNNVSFKPYTFAGQITNTYTDDEGQYSTAEIFNNYEKYDWDEENGEWTNHNDLDFSNKAEGAGAHAEGYITIALGKGAHAEGIKNSIFGDGNHAEGIENKIELLDIEDDAKASHLEGQENTIYKGVIAGHAEGYQTQVTESYAHAEGRKTQANGESSHAEGKETQANGIQSHTEGYKTLANGNCSHSEGIETQANGECSHAEGNYCTAFGFSSHAEGEACRAIGTNSHAEGWLTQAEGNNSHAGGFNTIANQENQTVIGQYNLNPTDECLFIVGNGDSNNSRSNAFEVYKDGHAEIQYTNNNNEKEMSNVVSEAYIRDNVYKTYTSLSSVSSEFDRIFDTNNLGYYKSGDVWYPVVYLNLYDIVNKMQSPSGLYITIQTVIIDDHQQPIGANGTMIKIPQDKCLEYLKVLIYTQEYLKDSSIDRAYIDQSFAEIITETSDDQVAVEWGAWVTQANTIGIRVSTQLYYDSQITAPGSTNPTIHRTFPDATGLYGTQLEIIKTSSYRASVNYYRVQYFPNGNDNDYTNDTFKFTHYSGIFSSFGWNDETEKPETAVWSGWHNNITNTVGAFVNTALGANYYLGGYLYNP